MTVGSHTKIELAIFTSYEDKQLKARKFEQYLEDDLVLAGDNLLDI